MNLKKVKTITYILLGAMCVLLVAMGITRAAALGYIASAVIILTAIFEQKFWRCPHCGKFLGPLDNKGKYCRHCGHKVEM